MDISETKKQTIYQHTISTILGEPAAKLHKPVPNTTKIIVIPMLRIFFKLNVPPNKNM